MQDPVPEKGREKKEPVLNFLSNQETGQLFPLNTRESLKQNNNEQEDNNTKKQQQW